MNSCRFPKDAVLLKDTFLRHQSNLGITAQTHCQRSGHILGPDIYQVNGKRETPFKGSKGAGRVTETVGIRPLSNGRLETGMVYAIENRPVGIRSLRSAFHTLRWPLE